MPTSASDCHTASASSTPRSTVRASVPWSLNASIVASGIVLTVNGPIRLVDVHRVGVGLVLRRRARPQRALHLGAAGGQRLPALPAERLREQPVGELALGDGRLAAQRQRLGAADLLEAPVDLGVDAGDEEAGDAGDGSQLGAVLGGERLEPVEVGVDHLGVAVEAEDQRHVGVAALGDHRADRADTFGGRRDLDHHVAPGDALVKLPCRLLGARLVVGEAGVDLDADEAVGAARLVVDRFENLGGAGDVLEHHRPVVGDGGVLVEGEHAELLVVVGGALDRLLEDRRVRRQPADALVAQARRAGPT